MRLSVVTFGSEGDTRPLAALCRGLLDRGHHLTLFAEHSTLSLPRSLGIPCEILSGDVKSALPIGDPRQALPMSRELVPQPADWPRHHRICGHWSLPAIEWQPPEDLLEFLAAGEPPIYAGFGSPAAFIRCEALTALVDAIAGRRAIVSPGWSRIDSTVLPRNFHVARDVPHEWLFPRVAMAIHHGGAGTTHTAARAGIPQVVLPIGADHHFWAHRVALRGAAPKYPSKGRFDSRAVATMIEFAQRDDTRMHARALGEAMSHEDGVGTAIREIERAGLSDERDNLEPLQTESATAV